RSSDLIPISARSGKGIPELEKEIEKLVGGPDTEAAPQAKPGCGSCSGCPYQARYEWTEKNSNPVMDGTVARRSARTEKIDEIVTHPVIGVIVFQLVMLVIFALIFWAAQIPMHLIDHLFATIGTGVGTMVPAGDLQSLMVNGVIGGVGGIL